jgi:CRAL/TRIO domain.
MKMNIFFFQKGFNMRIKEIHLLNVPSFAEIMVNLIKSVLKPKIASRVSTLTKYF